MAEYFCDHGAYATALGATPTWGVPQEGDGSATTAASASAIASIVVNAVAVATNTIGICGLTFTAVASGATVTQFNVGATTQIQADNIAAAFNASTTAVGASVASGVPQLRNLLYARSAAGGAPANTVQIMMRIGATSLNHASNANVTIVSGGWGTPPTITNFIGGTGGCYGTFINSAAMGVSNSIAAMTYGVKLFKPYVNLPTIADRLFVRTGDNPTISYSLGSAMTLTATYAVKMFFDTNTKWTGDSTTGTLTLNLTITTGSSSYIYPSVAAAPNSQWVCLRRGNYAINYTNSTGGSLTLGNTGSGFAGSSVIDGVAITDNSPSGIGVSFATFGGSGQLGSAIWRNIDYTRTVSVLTQPGIVAIAPYSTRGSIMWEGCTFNYAISGGGDPGAIFTLGSYAPSTDLSIILKNCTFTGYANGFSLYAAAIYLPNDTAILEVVVSGCGGITMPSAYFGIASNNQTYLHSGRRVLNYADANGGFRYENSRAVTEFVPSGNFPYLDSYLFDEVTAWSQRMVWLNGVITHSAPGITSPIGLVSREATAVKTLTLEFYVSSTFGTLTPYSGYVSFNYTDNNNVVQTEAIPLIDMVSSSASWSAGGTSGYSAKKITCTTAYQVKQKTEVFAQVIFTDSPPSGAAEYLYVNPAVEIA